MIFLLTALLWAGVPMQTEMPESHVTPLDEVACAVNDIAITRTQVEQEARIRLAEKGAYWGGRLPPDYLEAVMDDMVSRELLRQEAERIEYRKNDKDSNALRGQLLDRFRSVFLELANYRYFLTRMQLSEEGLVSRLLRNRLIDDFVEERLQLIVRLDERKLAERLRLITAREFVGEQEVESLRKKLRFDMEREEKKQALERWIKQLAERGRVYQLVKFDQPSDPLPALHELGVSK